MNCGWIRASTREEQPFLRWLPAPCGPLPGLDLYDLQLGDFVVPGGRDLVNCHSKKTHFVRLDRVSRKRIPDHIGSSVGHAHDRLLYAADYFPLCVVKVHFNRGSSDGGSPRISDHAVNIKIKCLAVGGLAHLQTPQ